METIRHNLEEAWSHMRWGIEPRRFVLVGFPDPPTPSDLDRVGEGPGQVIREGGETTLLLPESHLPDLRAVHPGLREEGPLVWVRFEAPMGWEVVGFLARVTTALAGAGIPLGAVCGFSRDHLFVAEAHLEGTRSVLSGLFPGRELGDPPPGDGPPDPSTP